MGELKNLVQRVLVLGAGEEIRLEEIERELQVKLAVDEPLVKQDLKPRAPLCAKPASNSERASPADSSFCCATAKWGSWPSRSGGMEPCTHLYRKLRALGVDFRQLWARIEVYLVPDIRSGTRYPRLL